MASALINDFYLALGLSAAIIGSFHCVIMHV